MNQIYKWSRWALGIIFIYAGITKLMDPRVFAVLIEAYGIVPEGLIFPAAVLLPLIEVVAGLFIVFDIRGSLAVICGLTIFFMIILGYGIHMGLDVDCGCFGPEDPESRAFHGLRQAFIRDVFMLLDILFIYIWRRYQGIAPRFLRDFVTDLRSILYNRHGRTVF
ncbi:MauE/DoxX family redox-associated membrane protein [Desulfocicer vacuolatum]|nr:MauE/DoxX family redox-associated membrane protein [Desulfocicer vacuolatum]